MFIQGSTNIGLSKLSWLIDVLSGVPQAPILGRLLFVIFIYDLDDGVINKLLKFADDTKIVSKVCFLC